MGNQKIKNIIPYQYHNLVINYRDDDKDDWSVVREMFLHNIYRFNTNMLRDESIVVDIGANIGAFSLQVLSEARDSNKKVHVIAIEPEKSNLELLYKNIEENPELFVRGSTIEVLEIGIYNEYGKANINSESGSSRLTDNQDDQEVTVWPYDKLIEHIGKKIDFVKIDIEGSEIETIEGASEESILASHFYAIEFDERNTDDDFITLIEPFLYDFSFSTFGVPKNGCNLYLENHSWEDK